MTLVVVIIVGLLGTLLFGWLAYRHWVPYVPRAEEPMQVTAPAPHVISGSRNRWLWWPVAMLVVIVIGIGAYRYFPWSYWSAPTSTTFTVTAGRDWSSPVRVPLGGRIRWERENVSTAYEFKTQMGVVHTRPEGPVEFTDHGKISSVQFRALKNKNVVIRVRITQ